MSTNNQPVMDKQQLIKSILIALFIGGIVLVTAILPAEYNIDPLGAGKLLGFNKLYTEPASTENIELGTTSLKFKKLTIEKIGPGPEAIPPKEIFDPAPAKQYDEREDHTIVVTVQADKGIEYKFKMLKYGKTKYEWSTDGTILYSDMHGEVLMENPPEEEFFESYTEAYSNNMTGTLTAPFSGIHGWYFRNKTKEEVKVYIKLKGQYQLFDIYNRH